MQFKKETISILKNFSTINTGVHFKIGKTISTVNTSLSLYAIAHLCEEITDDFAIYDLPRFLSTLSLFENPTINLVGKKITISEGSKRVYYSATEPSLIVTPKSDKLVDMDVLARVNLSSKELSDSIKALSVLGLPQLAFVGKNGDITVQACDSSNKGSDSFSVKIGETDKEFSCYIRAENLKFIPGDYTLEVTKIGAIVLKSQTLKYVISSEMNSTTE